MYLPSVSANRNIQKTLDSFENYYEEIAPIPTEAVLLGKCREDKQPVFWDISRASGFGGGPLQVIGNVHWSRYILFDVVFSLVMENAGKRKVVVVSRNPEEWNSFYRKFGFDFLLRWMKVVPSYRSEADNILAYISEYAETHKPYESEKIVLMVDDYSGLFSMDAEHISEFGRILNRTSSAVQVVATVDKDLSLKMPLAPFTTIEQNFDLSFSFEDASRQYTPFTFLPLDYNG